MQGVGGLPLMNAAPWSVLVGEARRRNAISATIIVNELTGEVISCEFPASAEEVAARRAAATLRAEQGRGR